MFNKIARNKIAVSFIAILMASIMLLSSCGGKGDEKETDTSSSTVTPVPEGIDINYKMDYMSEDLTAYLTLGQYKGFSATVETYEITDEYIQKELNKLLKEYAYSPKITDRKTKEGDVVNVDYSGSHNGVVFQGGTAKGQRIELKENNGYIPGFADGMYDVMPGETVSYEVTFPDTYPNNPDLAGEKTVFTVTVNYIEGEEIIPELNDAFVLEHFSDKECNNTEDFMKYYEGFLRERREEQIQEQANNIIWGKIQDDVTVIKLPTKAVESLYWSYRKNFEEYAAQSEMSYSEFLATYVDTDDAGVLANAENYIKDDLIIYSIVKAEGLEITDAEYNEGVEYYSAYYEMTKDELLETYPEEQIISVLQWNKLMNNIYQWSDVEIIYETENTSENVAEK